MLTMFLLRLIIAYSTAYVFLLASSTIVSIIEHINQKNFHISFPFTFNFFFSRKLEFWITKIDSSNSSRWDKHAWNAFHPTTTCNGNCIQVYFMFQFAKEKSICIPKRIQHLWSKQLYHLKGKTIYWWFPVDGASHKVHTLLFYRFYVIFDQKKGIFNEHANCKIPMNDCDVFIVFFVA